jgi:signal transduction histidine kinase
LTLLLALAMLIALGSAAKIVDWRADAEMQQRFDASLLVRAQTFAALVDSDDSESAADPMAEWVAGFPGGASNDWYAMTCSGRTLVQSHPAPPPVATGNAPTFSNARLADGREVRVVALRFQPLADTEPGPVAAARGQQDSTCTLRYALDSSALGEILHTLDWILVGSILGACGLVLLLTPWLVRRGLRPLDALDRAMATIGPDAPAERLPESRTTELAPLVTRFNEVLARMDAGLARERQFASGLAHEFRTRIAELRTLVDVERRHPSGRDLDAVLAEVGSINAELEATVTALLQLTRIQSGLAAARSIRLPLAPLFARLCMRHQDAAQARGVQVDSSGGNPAAMIEADPALLEIVLDNLLGNAVAYAPAASVVTLQATAAGIEVCNAAPALQTGDLANFGQRFWRKDAQGAGHAGLGLALASAATQAIGAQLTFELRDGLLRATLTLKPN